MDERTLSAYDAKAAGYCDDWLGQPAPEDIQQLWRRFFSPGGLSADVGSGSGRDVDWLNRNGFPCVGLDASEGLLAQARQRFPQWRFDRARLPELAEVADAAYRNVVCETVLMHLPVTEVRAAVRALGRILDLEGTLYLSWRVTEGADVRDSAGRLYCAFPVQDVRDELRGCATLYDEEETSRSSGRRVHRLIVRRTAASG
jgi:ubiquinone/menaquinone biosynthesis C-methylase UbiE